MSVWECTKCGKDDDCVCSCPTTPINCQYNSILTPNWKITSRYLLIELGIITRMKKAIKKLLEYYLYSEKHLNLAK